MEKTEKKKIPWIVRNDLPILHYRRPPENEPYAYDPNSGTMDSHYGIGRLGAVYDPLDVFRKFPPPPKYHAGYFVLPVGLSALGLGSICAFHYARKQPVFSQIWMHVLAAGGGFVAGWYIWKRSRYNAAVRDAHYIRYIELHPEDFPPIERHKFRDTLTRWRAVRTDDLKKDTWYMKYPD